MAGFGAAFSPELQGDGLARAVRAAMDDAGIGPEEVDHVNAHGLASKASDEWEAKNLQSVFGASDTPVMAVKSYIGNLARPAARRSWRRACWACTTAWSQRR